MAALSLPTIIVLEVYFDSEVLKGRSRMRVLVVDEEPRAATRLSLPILEEAPDVVVTDWAATSEEGVRLAALNDVLLVNMATVNPDRALQLVRVVATSYLDVKVLVMGSWQSEEEILPYVEAGADGYIDEDDDQEVILRKVRAAFEDEAVISPRVTAMIMARIAEIAGGRQQLFIEAPWILDEYELSPEERELLALAGRGLSNDSIARRLEQSSEQVVRKLRRIYDKLGVEDRQEAIAVYKLRLGNEDRLSAYGD